MYEKSILLIDFGGNKLFPILTYCFGKRLKAIPLDKIDFANSLCRKYYFVIV